MSYADTYQSWKSDPESFWMQAAKGIDWIKPPSKALFDDDAPLYQWFADAQVNACWNAVDRHVEAGRGDQLAIIHDSPITHSYRGITYKDLQTRVASLAGALRAKGITAEVQVVELREHARDLADNLLTGFANTALQRSVDTVVGADALIAVTPGYPQIGNLAPALLLLARLMGLNEVQEGVLTIAFQLADEEHLLLLDLDDYQRVNRALGYDAGDEMLRDTARRLLNMTNPNETVARVASDDLADRGLIPLPEDQLLAQRATIAAMTPMARPAK